MKRTFLTILWIAAIAIPALADDKPAPAPALTTDKDKSSYSIGVSVGASLKDQGIDVNQDLLIQGLRDGLSGGNKLLSDSEIQEILMSLQKQVIAKRNEEKAKEAEKNKTDGAAFLAANKTKEGVVTTASGLQYKILKAGTGPKPKATDTITAHYRGTLLDGTEFDSSYSRGEPATLQVDGILKGWTEALQLMPVGSKWQLFLPPDLAYGEEGAGGVIGPNATLIFEVELLSIGAPASEEKSEQQPQTMPGQKQ